MPTAAMFLSLEPEDLVSNVIITPPSVSVVPPPAIVVPPTASAVVAAEPFCSSSEPPPRKRQKGCPVPELEKNDLYKEMRRRKNESAKRSRDAKRLRDAKHIRENEARVKVEMWQKDNVCLIATEENLKEHLKKMTATLEERKLFPSAFPNAPAAAFLPHFPV